MKISRIKKVQKNLGFFKNNFGFREPFQILIDGTFTFAAREQKFNIKEQLGKYFQAEVKLLTTACIILETEKLASVNRKISGASWIVKQFPLHKCDHTKKTLTGSECLLSMVSNNNPSRYIIATQDCDLQERIRNTPGIPLLYLHGKVPILDNPSRVNSEFAKELRNKVVSESVNMETIKILKARSGLGENTGIKLKKKRKKGGPNPLSCKKKQKKSENSSNQSTKRIGKVRKRRRVKLAAHIKEALKSQILS